MEKYKLNYLKAFGLDKTDFIACEMCQAPCVDFHHVEPKSSFGSKEKDKQDDVSNIIALCRECHNKAHGPLSRWYKGVFKTIIENRK